MFNLCPIHVSPILLAYLKSYCDAHPRTNLTNQRQQKSPDHMKNIVAETQNHQPMITKLFHHELLLNRKTQMNSQPKPIMKNTLRNSPWPAAAIPRGPISCGSARSKRWNSHDLDLRRTCEVNVADQNKISITKTQPTQ